MQALKAHTMSFDEYTCCTCTNTRMCTRIYTCTAKPSHNMHSCTHTLIYIHTHRHMHTRIYTHTHMFTNTHGVRTYLKARTSNAYTWSYLNRCLEELLRQMLLCLQRSVQAKEGNRLLDSVCAMLCRVLSICVGLARIVYTYVTKKVCTVCDRLFVGLARIIHL